MVIDDIDFRDTLVTFCVLLPRKTIRERLRLSIPFEFLMEEVVSTHYPLMKGTIFFLPSIESKDRQAYKVRSVKVRKGCKSKLEYTYFLQKHVKR